MSYFIAFVRIEMFFQCSLEPAHLHKFIAHVNVRKSKLPLRYTSEVLSTN